MSLIPVLHVVNPSPREKYKTGGNGSQSVSFKKQNRWYKGKREIRGEYNGGPGLEDRPNKGKEGRGLSYTTSV